MIEPGGVVALAVLVAAAIATRRQRRARVGPDARPLAGRIASFRGGRATIRVAQHVGRRREQQDAYAFAELADAVVAVVADGMGGLELGAEASRVAVDAFVEALKSGHRDDVSRRLDRAVVAANDAVVRLARAAGLLGDVGTTIAAVAIGSDGLRWTTVGDTRVYRWRDATLVQLSTDHVSAPHSLTSWLGETMLAEIGRGASGEPLRDGDVVLLCTDGVHDSIDDDELATLAGDADAEAIVQAVLRRDRPNQDNATVVALAISTTPAR